MTTLLLLCKWISERGQNWGSEEGIFLGYHKTQKVLDPQESLWAEILNFIMILVVLNSESVPGNFVI